MAIIIRIAEAAQGSLIKIIVSHFVTN